MQHCRWSDPVTTGEAYSRAGGRRRYNSWRRLKALLRRRRVVELAWQYGLVDWGSATRIAEVLGVHRSTVSRDIKAILAELNKPRPCLCSGAKANWVHQLAKD